MAEQKLRTQLAVGTKVNVYEDVEGEMCFVGQGEVISEAWPFHTIRLTTGEIRTEHTCDLIPVGGWNAASDGRTQ